MNTPVKLLYTVGMIGSLLICAGATAQVNSPGRSYCCMDSTNHRVCGDTLPQICYDRAYKEIAPSGRTIRDVPAPLTATERKKRDEVLQMQIQQERLVVDAQRRDAILLETYSTVEELDTRRERDINRLNNEVRRAKARESDLVAERGTLEKLKIAKSVPTQDLDIDLSSNLVELAQIRTLISLKIRDIEQLKLKYDGDRKRLVELKRQAAAATDHN